MPEQVAQGQRSLTPESRQLQSLDKVLFFLFFFFVCVCVCVCFLICFVLFLFLLLFFLPYMGIMAILVMYQVYGCNSFHRIIGPVNTYPCNYQE